MTREIMVHAIHTADKRDLLRKHTPSLEHIRTQLARSVSERVMLHPDVFTESDWSADGKKTYCATCIVLTPRGFDDLVEKISRDIERGIRPMYGGVYTP